jgi:phosphate uptake regulator
LSREEYTIKIKKIDNIEEVLYLIESLYASGARLINLEMETPATAEQFQKIQELILSLPGYEVTVKTPKNISLQDIMEMSHKSILETISNSVLHLMEDIVESVESFDIAKAEAVELAHDNVHRYCQRYRRQAHSGPSQNVKELLNISVFISNLENIANYLSYIAHSLSQQTLPSDQTKQLLKILIPIKEAMSKTIETFLTKNVEKAQSILRGEGLIRKEIDNLLNRVLSYPDRTVRLIIESIMIHSGEILRNLHQILINTIK